MNRLKLSVIALSLLLLAPIQSTALEVDREVMPRVTLGGRVIASMESVDRDSEPDDSDEISLSDSSFLMRFDKRAYSGGVTGAVIGLTEDDDRTMLHQLSVFYWNQHLNAQLGRTRLRNTLIEFPLIRDDDFISYTHIGNGSSDDEFDQIYAEQIAVDWFLDKKIQTLGIWAATRRNGEQAIFDNSPDGIDSYGIGWVYEEAEDRRFVKRITHAGVLLNRQKVDTSGADEWMNAIIAGLELNLNMDPTQNWRAALQLVSNGGVNDASVLGSVSQRAKAKSNAITASIRYLSRPHLLTRWQGALNMAYKEFPDVDSASQWSIAPNFIYRIAQGVEMFSQLSYSKFSSALGNGEDMVFQAGLTFSLETMFNDNIGERDSILNLEHGYID